MVTHCFLAENFCFGGDTTTCSRQIIHTSFVNTSRLTPFITNNFSSKKLVKGDSIKIFNYGNCKRDFTYVDDIVEGVVRVMQHVPEKSNGADGLPIPPSPLEQDFGFKPSTPLREGLRRFAEWYKVYKMKDISKK